MDKLFPKMKRKMGRILGVRQSWRTPPTSAPRLCKPFLPKWSKDWTPCLLQIGYPLGTKYPHARAQRGCP